MLPFIYLVIHTDNSTNIDKLLMKAFKSDEEFLNHAQNILQLVDKLSNTNDKNAYILIRGYIIKHIETCEESNCPLKYHQKMEKKRQEEKKGNKDKKKRANDPELNMANDMKEIRALVDMLDNQYKINIRK